MWEIVVDKDECDCQCSRADHFEEVEYIEPCMICRNKDTDKCYECFRN